VNSKSTLSRRLVHSRRRSKETSISDVKQRVPQQSPRPISDISESAYVLPPLELPPSIHSHEASINSEEPLNMGVEIPVRPPSTIPSQHPLSDCDAQSIHSFHYGHLVAPPVFGFSSYHNVVGDTSVGRLNSPGYGQSHPWLLDQDNGWQHHQQGFNIFYDLDDARSGDHEPCALSSPQETQHPPQG
jgi:hypothetical protein